MRPIVATLLLAALALPAAAQAVKLPPEIRVAPGRLAAVTVEWSGDDLRWDVPAALDCFREYDPDPSKVRLRLIGYEPGTHRLLAVACKGGKLSDFAVCTVTVGTPVPPPPPGPTDPLAQALQAACAADPSPNRAALVQDLAALYSAVGGAVLTSPTLKVNKDALVLLQTAVANHPTLKSGGLAGVKDVVRQELNKLGLYDTDALTDAGRQRIANALTRCAALLGGVK